MALLPADSVDAVVTDPPYGLSKEPDMAEVLRHWLAGDDYSHGFAGFMGKTWDSFVPGPAVWREAYRVLKPGGHLVAFFGTRTYDLGVLAIRLAGFEIRDQIGWLYGSGFPKSHNLEGINEGWGTALKPAQEPIVLARKPLVGSVAANVQAYGTGALNIDGCRVHTDDGENRARPPRTPNTILGGGKGTNLTASPHNADGRWPANLIHDGSDEVLAVFPDSLGQIADASTSASPRTPGQTSGAMRRGNRGEEPSANSPNVADVGFKMRPGARREDTGSAARFFYCTKATTADREEGLEALAKVQGVFWQTGNGASGEPSSIAANRPARAPRTNNHPTVKPTALMAYLCRLVTPPGGLILDPFMGSGSTGKAARREGFGFIGIELDAAYAAIARARIDA
jgi:site-specific DNA-methyltransferase (adenine-specific)